MAIENISEERKSYSRVYTFFAALLGIGAFIAWQSYGSTEKLNAAPASSFSSPVSTEVASATSELVTSTSGQGAADPTNQTAIVSPPAPAVPSIDTRRLDAIVSELSVVRLELQQLAAKQEEKARNVATLQAARENSKEKLPPPADAMLWKLRRAVHCRTNTHLQSVGSA